MTIETESTGGPTVANHHADHPGFSGVGGLLAALSMVPFRSETGRLAADMTGVAPGAVVVDVGCGPGAAARVAAKRGASVTGIDPASVMLSVARLAPGARRVTWSKGVAEDLLLEDDSADVVWSLACVHHWPDIEGGLAEARRVLRPGGRFLAIERRTSPGATGLASHGWTDAQAERFAEDCRVAGFVDVEVSREGKGGSQLAVLALAPR